MSLQRLPRRPITIVHPGETTDRYNNTVADWSTATRTPTMGKLDQADTVEVAVGRDTIIADSMLYLDPDESIDGRCRVEVDAATFEVVGEPELLPTPRGPHHFQVHLRSVNA